MAFGTSLAAANKPLPPPIINSFLLTRFPSPPREKHPPINIILQAIDLFPAPDFSLALFTPLLCSESATASTSIVLYLTAN